MATRRQVLGNLALGLGVLACRDGLAQPAERAAYVGIETSARTGLSKTAFFTTDGARLPSIPLEFRAHGMAQHKDALVVFPRRPGNTWAMVDLTTLEIKSVVTAPADRHFYGHGAFTQDGQYLLVSENDLNTLLGSIGVYDVSTKPRRIGQIDLPGAGPHEIIRISTKNRFVVALGGLQTHPDYGRMPLNLADFRSQLITLSFERGVPEEMGHWPGSDGISLRHLAQDKLGRLYVGGQVVDPSRAQVDQVLWLVEADSALSIPVAQLLGGYVSSVAAHGRQAMVSSKASDLVVTLDGAIILEKQTIIGASAVGIGPSGRAISGFRELRFRSGTVTVTKDQEFDNHGLILL